MSTGSNRLERDLRRCEEAIHAAETLLAENLYLDSISRAYYAVIHAVMLLLAAGGHGTRNPDEAGTRFTPARVAGLGLSPQASVLFERVQRAKTASASDYLARYSGDYALETLREAREFVDLTRQHLSGYHR